MTRRIQLGPAELALAYELRHGDVKCRWSLIARALGVSEWYLQTRMIQVKREGLKCISR